ncbi:hypothetical protein DDE83_006949 [Stemphylium lycopersici]|uniref:Pentatricopeptide repeat protein n=1 Tax=Stemphylium lycopersici TaxID=183478 RepID=A0A364MY87_STELY|nr:hypothetical protein DDE83_006949 [Stemphylium lycopersici]
MLGAYVCRQCRTRLFRRTAPVRNPQWQPRASIVLFAGAEPQHNADAPQDEAETPVKENRPAAREPNNNGPTFRYETPGFNQTRSGQTQSSRTRPSRYSRLIGDDVVGDPTYTIDWQEAAYEEAEQIEVSTGEQTFADPIAEALRATRIQKAWDLFEKTYTARDCKALTESNIRGDGSSTEEFIFRRLLNAVSSAFCAGRKSVRVTPTEVLFKYDQLGICRPDHWIKPTLARLTYEVIQAVNIPSDTPRRRLPEVLHELLSIWRLFFHCMGPKDSPRESISAEWPLPSVETLPELYDSPDFNMRLQDYIPKYTSSPMIGFCAVYLYSISDALHPEIQQEAAPFLRFLERLLAGSRVDTIYYHTRTFDLFKELPNNVQKQIIREIEVAPTKALVAIGKSGETLGSEATGDQMTNLEAHFMKRISRAVESMTSPAMLDNILKEVEETYVNDDKTLSIPRPIYNGFLSGYLILLKSERSIQVWNHMIAHGIMPDMNSWVAVMEGCAKAKDLDGFNAMWQRMLNTGVEPTNHAWTTRVNGLMSLRQVNQALGALDDMGKRWLAAEEAIKTPPARGKGQKSARKASSKAVNNCTKPSIEVINGAITALVKMRPESMRHDKRVDFVQKVLGWSSRFQIAPDTITYNSLMQLYLGANDTRTAFAILSTMEKEGIEGDTATYTMLIATAFSHQVFDSATPAEQTTKVLSTIDALEASGMKLNDYVYSTIIDRLLKTYANYHAVRAVMQHMTTRKFIPSAHVYTSLITHHFQASPPNIGEVDSIVNLLFTSPRMASDRVLYDRLIEGYAAHAEVGKMMAVLARMSRRGNLPGWGALIAVVKALVRDGDFDRARIIVRDVERGEGVAKGGVVRDRRGEMAFANLVREVGLGGEEAEGVKGVGMGEYLGGAKGERNGGAMVEDMVVVQGQGRQNGVDEEKEMRMGMEQDIHGFLQDGGEVERRS